MLTENDVIGAVARKLEDNGFEIKSTCNTTEHGVDIAAIKDKYKLLIEAKGGTSSKEGTNRNGKPFDRNQARTHISVALFTAMSYITQYACKDNIIIGIALPYEKNHKEFINRVRTAINKLQLVVFWVNNDKVTIDIPEGHIFETLIH